MTPPLLAFVAPGLTLLYAGSFLAGELHLFWYGWRARRWGTTSGIILHSEVRVGAAPAQWGKGWRAARYPSVIYQYTVGQTVYHGSHLGYSGTWYPVRWSVPWKQGEHVRVHYDPANPSHAVLRPGVSSANVWAVLLGLVAVGLALWWVVVVAGAA